LIPDTGDLVHDANAQAARVDTHDALHGLISQHQNPPEAANEQLGVDGKDLVHIFVRVADHQDVETNGGRYFPVWRVFLALVVADVHPDMGDALHMVEVAV
jgi:hypothetical protein